MSGNRYSTRASRVSDLMESEEDGRHPLAMSMDDGRGNMLLSGNGENGAARKDESGSPLMWSNASNDPKEADDYEERRGEAPPPPKNNRLKVFAVVTLSMLVLIGLLVALLMWNRSRKIRVQSDASQNDIAMAPTALPTTSNEGIGDEFTWPPSVSPSLLSVVVPTQVGSSNYNNIASIVRENNVSLPDTFASNNTAGSKDTPQQKAIDHFASNDAIFAGWTRLLPEERPPMERILQRYSAGVFYMSTNGEYWFNKSGWMEGDVHECDWQGMECSAFNVTSSRNSNRLTQLAGVQSINKLPGGTIMTRDEHDDLKAATVSRSMTQERLVTQLQLLGNNVTGTLPRELHALKKMRVLSFWNADGSAGARNDLTGSLPSEIGNMTDLTRLWLNGNRITGSIPTEFGLLSNMQDLSLSNNSIAGSLPTELGSLTNMIIVSVWGNKLTGSLPSELGLWSDLKLAFFDQNNLTGTLPEEVGAWSNLKDFRIFKNQLTGNFPDSMEGMSVLETFYVDTNKMNGTISAKAVSGWTSLEQFEAFNNDLDGSIPPEFGSLSSLRTLSLYENKLTGAIPSTICDGGALVTLALSSNRLKRSIPSSISQCGNLENLLLDDNELTGSFPSTNLTQLKNLKTLALQNNQLEGTIPTAELSAITSLRTVRLENNSFTGTIDAEFCIGKLTLSADCNPSDNQVDCTCCTDCF